MGHYEFEILLTKNQITILENKQNIKKLSERTIYRRFSDFEIWYEDLVKYNPGCLIPKIPEKSFWCNFSWSNNSKLVNKRKQQIENYLNYINKHSYLSKNPVYLIFISDDYERYRTEIKDNVALWEIVKHKGIAIMNTINVNITGNDWTKKGYEISDENLKMEKLRWQRIEAGVKETIKFIESCWQTIKTKMNSLGGISSILSQLKESNFQMELKGINNDYVAMKKKIGDESECYRILSEKWNDYYNDLDSWYDDFSNYNSILTALIEIFDRKEEQEFKLKREKNEDFMIGDNSKNEIADLEEKVKKMNLEFFDEWNNFNEVLENKFIDYMERLISTKIRAEKEEMLTFKGEFFNVVHKDDTIDYVNEHFS